MSSRMRSSAAADAESRKKLFRATAGLSLQQQLQVATQLQTNGNDVMQKIQQIKKVSKQQKQITNSNNLKVTPATHSLIYIRSLCMWTNQCPVLLGGRVQYEWLHEHHHLKKLEEACSKDLESLLLRIYNEACSTDKVPASASAASTAKPAQQAQTKSPACPEYSEASDSSPSKEMALLLNNQQQQQQQQQYAAQLDELLQLEQANRLARLQHAASERDQRRAMTQLLHGLKQRRATSSKSNQSSSNSLSASSSAAAASAVAEFMKRDAQELIFDAVIGHEMVAATLDDELQQCEKEFQKVYESVVSSLHTRNYSRPGNPGNPADPADPSQDDEKGLDAKVQSLIQATGGCSDELLLLEIREEWQKLDDELRNDLTIFERDFQLLARQNSGDETTIYNQNEAGTGKTTQSTGGWSREDDERFLTVMKNTSGGGRRGIAHAKPEILYDQVKAVLPHKTVLEIQKHVKFHTHLRFYTSKCRDRQADYDRKICDFQATAKEKILQQKRQEDDKTAKMEKLQKLQNESKQRHEKVDKWKISKDAQRRIQRQQEEIAQLLAQQQKDEEQVILKKRQDEIKLQLDEYRNYKAVEQFVESVQSDQQRCKEEFEKVEQSLVNAERVQYRQSEYERKLAQEKLEQQEKDRKEAERLEKLDALRQNVPYADRIAEIVADPERTRQETAAFRANVDAVDDGLPLHEKGLFPTHGYDTTTLFKNARFKLGIALRNAGLHSTDYARQALATIKVSNVGAYRHAVAPSTQLW